MFASPPSRPVNQSKWRGGLSLCSNAEEIAIIFTFLKIMYWRIGDLDLLNGFLKVRDWCNGLSGERKDSHPVITRTLSLPDFRIRLGLLLADSLVSTQIALSSGLV